MKCPRCGHWNKPSFPRCFQCGEPLGAKDAAAPGWQANYAKPRRAKTHVIYDDTMPVETDILPPEDANAKAKETLATEMVRLKERRARGEAYLKDARRNAAARGIAPSGAGVSGQRARAFRGENAAPEEAEPVFYETLEGGDGGAYDDLPPAYGALPPLAPPKVKRARLGAPLRAAIWIIALMLLVAVGAGALFLIQSQTTPNPVAQAPTPGVTVDPITIEGQAGRRIRIPEKEGTKIYISELEKSFVVIGGVATIDIADYTFYNDIPELYVETMDVTLTPTALRTEGETKLAPIRYTVNIPASTLVITRPESDFMEVSTSSYNLMMLVEPGSRVLVNNVDITDTVGDDGAVSYNPPIKAIGNNYIIVTARAQYCRQTTATLTFYRAPMEIPLDLPAGTMTSTSLGSPTFTPTTLPGATITVESPHENLDTTHLAETGEFSFNAIMGHTGYNTVRIRASQEGKADSILEHQVYYVPSIDVYSRKAWTFTRADYDDLLKTIAKRTEEAQIYQCTGVITRVLSEKPQLAMMDTGTDGREQLVLLQNETATPWVEGQTYTVYADVSGMYNTMPRLIARYEK